MHWLWCLRESLSVYVGLELFGFFGFILGPLGLLLIEDMVEAWTKEEETET